MLYKRISLGTIIISQLVILFSLTFTHVMSADPKPTVDSELLEQMNSIAVKEWQTVEKSSKSIDVSYRKTYQKGRLGQLKTDLSLNLRIAYDAKRKVTLFRSQDASKPGPMNHQVANSGYDFEVSATDNSTRCTLHRLSLAPLNGEGVDLEDGLPTWKDARCDLLAACRLSCMPLSDLLNPTEFKITELVEYEELNQRRIRHTVQYLGKEGMVRRVGATYRLVYDPTSNFRLLNAEITVPGKSLETFTVTYHENAHVSMPHKLVYRLDMQDYRVEQVTTYELPKPCTIPDAEFYLPHYGISESVLETLHPNPWPRWLLIGFGIVTIAIGAWLVRGRRQPAA